MNAKKIMGAVLVALLAAALFVGAGAAVTTKADGDIVFVNQMVSKTIYGGNWVGPNGAYTPADVPAASATKVYFGEAGTYTAKVNDQTITLTVKAPELVIAGVVDGKYTFIPGDFYQGNGEGVIYIQNPASNAVTYTLYYNGEKQNNNAQITVPNDATTGEKTIQAEFNAGAFVAGTTPEQLITAPVTFSVVDGDTAVAISAAATSVLKSDNIKLTVTGQPGIAYNVTFDYGAFTVAKQIGFNTFANINGTVVGADQKTGIQFTMPAGGKATFNIKAVEAVAGDSEKITVQAVGGTKKASVTIEFKKGTISAKADAASYYVGDIVTITGTRTTGQISNLTIKGTNFVNETLMDHNTVFAWENSGKNFEFTLDTSKILDNGKKLDVGTYTLTLNASGTKATVPLVLKQPFISIVEAPEVIVQDTEAEFIINAEAAAEIAYYIFGTNYFAYGKTENHPEDDEGEEILTQFVVGLNETQTKGMDAGQYFAVFQHPMYDKELNIEAVGTAIMLGEVTLFNVDVRQTANAAQALCDALDTQNIDDVYVKYSFFVVGEDESFTISDIPTEVAKGDKIVISGVDTANAGKTVQVEMISTVFAAVQKETVGSAAFIVVTTEVAKDGSWEITLDTSDLNVDEYSLSIAINSVEKKNVNVNVVEGADEPVNPEQPEQPEQPEEPVAPATPGFGALAALAGLGAVAVLLLRRE
ncbi:MAG TPA: PGF-CTERM sorting domain-containing protein [Methanocorpusculum sp.]|nr:PGF-CTERM sorting domain-containing protein [Methanocorpusculum sp.]